MPDQATQRDRIRAVIRDFYGAAEGQFLPLAGDLADRIDKALSTTVTGTGEGPVGPFLTSEELGWMRAASNAQERRAPGGYLAMALRHVDAQAAVIANQNREMDDQQRRVRELGRLQSEVPLALFLTPTGVVLGRGVMADRVKLIAEVLRSAQAEMEARRG